VDDATVDAYGETLQAMERAAAKGGKDGSTIEFVSLWSLFFANPELAKRFSDNWLHDVEITHLVKTECTKEAELCRKLLMATCQTNPDVLRNLIKSEDRSSLALYRGFSRFMLEDLQFHPECIGRSISQRKKLATKVAAEMIKVSRADELRML
jgi:pyoverdine/dityrosine biosynthesis protein Dit1